MKIQRYVVVTPVRNEEQHLPVTIDSMVAQTVLPQQWIIVDDGSNDGTAKIAQESAKRYSWIQVIHRENRGYRKPGGGVVETFYDGYNKINSNDWQALVKLDGDLSFAPDFFEKCFEHFEKTPQLGIGGGTISKMVNNGLVPEAPGDPVFHVRGATKIYRRECWDALGGLIAAPGWDTVDEYKANMMGWTTCTFNELKLWHHRPAGGAQGTWKNWVKNGLANYIAGYHPLFMLMKCIRRAFAKPYGLMGLGLLLGFCSGYVRRVPQVGDKKLIGYVRSQQLRRLYFRESLWDRKQG